MLNPYEHEADTGPVGDLPDDQDSRRRESFSDTVPAAEEPNQPADRAYRVLAIDGGGVRGIIQARILTALEDATSRPVADLFDLIVGTSIGGIAALALTVPEPDGTPSYTPDSAAELLTGHKDTIFPARSLAVPRNITEARKLASTVTRTGLAATGRHRERGNARYSPEPLEAALEDFFGDAMLSDAITPVVVTAFDALTDMPVHFRSTFAANLAGCDVPMATVARAATAAPTFFPPADVEWAGRHTVLLDAGIYANDVSLVAYTEARMHAAAQGQDSDEILLVSLGSGRQYGSPDDKIDDVSRRNWVELADRLMKAAEVGHQETHHRLLNDLLGERYWRFQPMLPDGDGFGTDGASDEELSYLVSIADQFVVDHASQINQIADQLVSRDRQHIRPAEVSR